MNLVHSQPLKMGRSAILLEPVHQPGDERVAPKMPCIRSAGHHARSRSAQNRQTGLNSAAKTDSFSGLVFIAKNGATEIGFALTGSGVVVSAKSPIHLESGAAAEAFFCVATDSAFDTVFKTLRETCLQSPLSAVVFFGSAELPGQMSLRGLSRKSHFSEITLSANASRRGVGAEPTTGDWLQLVDLSCVRFGQHGPDVGPVFPQVVRLHLQTALLA